MNTKKAKPGYNGGAAWMRKKGLRGLLVPLTPEQHTAIQQAARSQGSSLAVYAAGVLDRDAKKILKKVDQIP